ncbi:MAG TPA: hypothetical protein VFV99_09995 [Kofleriaceae bacterium]|nr:hypothetical protein [Kofleriaceae bacterium]
MRAIVFVLLAGCGAQPNQPVLANAPKPDPGAVAGAAAAAAAAITLASPDSHTPEKRQNEEKKPVKVKENVSAGALDRLDASEAAAKNQPKQDDADAKPGGAKQQPAGAKTEPEKPKGALDFGQP